MENIDSITVMFPTRAITHWKLGVCHIDWLCVKLNRLDPDKETITVVWGGGLWQMNKTGFSPDDQLIAHGITKTKQ